MNNLQRERNEVYDFQIKIHSTQIWILVLSWWSCEMVKINVITQQKFKIEAFERKSNQEYGDTKFQLIFRDRWKMWSCFFFVFERYKKTQTSSNWVSFFLKKLKKQNWCRIDFKVYSYIHKVTDRMEKVLCKHRLRTFLNFAHTIVHLLPSPKNRQYPSSPEVIYKILFSRDAITGRLVGFRQS